MVTIATSNDTILVPLDGSTLAERVLPYAQRLTQAAHARLVLFQAVPEVAFVSRAERELDDVARRPAQQGVDTEVVVRHGDPAQLILREARERHARLIVLSTHGGSGHGRWLYGNIADAVLRGATAPVLLIPATSDHPWPTDRPLHLLVPLDGSEVAAEALGPAQDLARLLGSTLHLVQVVDTVVPYAYLQSAYPEAEEELAARRAASQTSIEEVARGIRDEGLPVETDAVVGTATAAVAALARERNVDLIVMTSLGAGGAAVATLGSVATSTLQRSPVPVLFVRPTTAQAQQVAMSEGTALEREGSVATLTLNVHELALLERGLDRLLGEIHPAEPAYKLAARLRQAQAAASHPRGGAPRTSAA